MAGEGAQGTETLTSDKVRARTLRPEAASVASLVSLAHRLLLISSLPIHLLSSIVSDLIIIDACVSGHAELVDGAVNKGRGR